MGFAQGTGLDGGAIIEVLSSEDLTKPMPTCAWGIFSDMFLFNIKKSFHPLSFSDHNTVCQQKAFWVQLCFSLTTQDGKK